MRSRPHRTGRGAAALAAWIGLACADAPSPGTRVCAEILALQAPGAEVVEAWPGAHGSALDYRVPGEDAKGVHRIECLIAEPEPGRLRAQSVRIEGRELSEAELVLVNAELLLAEIRRADPGPPRPPAWEAVLSGLRAGAVGIEATLSRLTREAISILDDWWRGPREDAERRAGGEARV